METAHQELGQTFSFDQNRGLQKKQVGRVTALFLALCRLTAMSSLSPLSGLSGHKGALLRCGSGFAYRRNRTRQICLTVIAQASSANHPCTLKPG
jgi:hypothetical protein